MLERHKGFDGINKPMGKKVFGVKLPVEYEQILINMTPEQRVSLIRGAIINAIEQKVN
jgi:hypothetical protein